MPTKSTVIHLREFAKESRCSRWIMDSDRITNDPDAVTCIPCQTRKGLAPTLEMDPELSDHLTGMAGGERPCPFSDLVVVID